VVLQLEMLLTLARMPQPNAVAVGEQLVGPLNTHPAVGAAHAVPVPVSAHVGGAGATAQVPPPQTHAPGFAPGMHALALAWLAAVSHAIALAVRSQDVAVTHLHAPYSGEVA
jgi:hypothetical protein